MKPYILIGSALLVLVLVFVFQRFNYAVALTSFLPEGLQITQPNTVFIVNKTIRLVLNDVACMVLIYAWFKERKYLTLSFYLFLVEVCLLLPIYFIVKLSLEGDSEISSPLLSQIHRLIVNPLLMFLLMAGFIYQRVRMKNA
ncbi:MAG: exosortase F system-associated protein [Cyclobacteriaceae bacterium]|nr:MAG: exosortase F system-associated protein [Cyclobacteriaceae bacterium]